MPDIQKAPPAAVAASVPPDTRAERAGAIVDAWVCDRIHNSPTSRDTEAWNHLFTALPDLKQRIAQELA